MGTGWGLVSPGATNETIAMQNKSKTALVTGGSRGIGKAIVQRLQNDGLTVVACGRSEKPPDFPAHVYWIEADVSNPADASRLVSDATQTYGTIDVLVNNAGVQVEKTVTESSDDDWDLVVGVNCRGVFNLCRAVLPTMQSNGGVIINIGSISGEVADPGMALYNASKAFVHGLTRSIAVDHGPNVRCNAIQPGWIMTAMADDAFAVANNPPAAKQDAMARHPAGRFGQPQDIANIVSWLASEDAAFVTGQCFRIDGGMTAASPLRPGLF